METRATYTCIYCSEFSCSTNNFYLMRYHCEKHHPGERCSTSQYKIKPLDRQSDIQRNTRNKRIRTAKKQGHTHFTPRNCSYIRPSGKACGMAVISAIRNKSSVRCRHHPLKDRNSADLHGMHDSSMRYVERKLSSIANAGYGVYVSSFAEYEPGEIITRYSGTLMNNTQILNKEHNQYYTVECRDFSMKYLSGITVPENGAGYGSFINCSTNDHPANCEFAYFDRKTPNEAVYMRAKKPIAANQELFLT